MYPYYQTWIQTKENCEDLIRMVKSFMVELLLYVDHEKFNVFIS